MPIYDVANCLTLQTVTVSAETLSDGQVISYNIIDGPEGPYECGTVVFSSSSETYEYTGATLFDDCCSCLSAETGSNFTSFQFENCNTLDTIDIVLSGFCNEYGSSPVVGEVFKFYQVSDPTNQFCATFLTGNSETGTELYGVEAEGPFSNCFDCGFNVARSANTEVYMCVICCPCTTGETINSVAPPNPVWTDSRGIAVTQLNMVTLGGNGLNS